MSSYKMISSEEIPWFSMDGHIFLDNIKNIFMTVGGSSLWYWKSIHFKVSYHSSVVTTVV